MAAGSEDAPGDMAPSKDTLTSNNNPTPVDDCMAVESEKEFGFNTKFSFHADYADTPTDNSSDKTSHLARKIKEILSKLKLTFGDHIQIRNWEGKTVELTEFPMPIDSLKNQFNYETLVF
jgi:hypothetical protein